MKVLSKRILRTFAAMGCLSVCSSAPATPQEQTRASQSAPGEKRAEAGRQDFESQCAGCHGLDGRGGERAPDIAANPKTRARTDQELLKMIREGVPGTGMPAFRSLSQPTASAVVNYLRRLQGNKSSAQVRGSATRGQDLFFGSGRCSECHTIGGKGGFIGSDLTAYSRTHTLEEMRQKMIAPETSGRGTMVEVRTNSGKSYSGVLRNEDNFSLQLQLMDGSFLLLRKNDLQPVSPVADSVHATLGSRLSAEEVRDLLSYLVRTGGPPRKQTKEQQFEE